MASVTQELTQICEETGWNSVDYQLEAVKKHISILEINHFSVDTTITGLGKTVVSLLTFAYLGYKRLLVVCPVNVMDKWEAAIQKFPQFEHRFEVVSYSTLRGAKSPKYDLGEWYPLRNGLLERMDDEETTVDARGRESVKKLVEFRATEELENRIERGMGVIFDEFHNMKNDSHQADAGSAVIKCVMGSEAGKSRMMFLSFTPADKEVHCVNFFRNLGVYTEKKLFDNSFGRGQRFLGLQEIHDYVEAVNPEAAGLIFDQYNNHFDSNKGKEYVLQYYTALMEVTSTAIPIRHFFVMLEKCKVDYYNGYFWLDTQQENDEILRIGDGIQLIVREMENGKIEGLLGLLTDLLVRLECAMVPVFARLVEQKLRENPHCKVVVAMNYLQSSGKELLRRLIENGVPEDILAMYNGEMQRSERMKAMKAFQTPDDEIRCLICTTASVKEGVDLHDTDGRYPRVALISPTYIFTYLVQMLGRVVRHGIKSPNTEVIVVYPLAVKGNTAYRMMHRIFSSLIKKSGVLRATLSQDCDISQITSLPDHFVDKIPVNECPFGVVTNTETKDY